MLRYVSGDLSAVSFRRRWELDDHPFSSTPLDAWKAHEANMKLSIDRAVDDLTKALGSLRVCEAEIDALLHPVSKEKPARLRKTSRVR